MDDKNRLKKAIECDHHATEIPLLAKRLRDEGMKQLDMYFLFEDCLIECDPNDLRYDSLVDTLDAFATGLFNRLVADCDRSTLDGRSYIDSDLAIFIPVYATIRKPFGITLILRITGRSLIISTEEWMAWQNSPDAIAPQYRCYPVERQFLRDNLPRIWRLLPNVESLISQTDWSDTERKWYV